MEAGDVKVHSEQGSQEEQWGLVPLLGQAHLKA